MGRPSSASAGRGHTSSTARARPGPRPISTRAATWCATCARRRRRAGAGQTYETLIKACNDEGSKKALIYLLTREVSHTAMFMQALDKLGYLTAPIFGDIPPDDTVDIYLNMSQGEPDLRGPWNQKPRFRYVADPKPHGNLPSNPTNPSDERGKLHTPKLAAKLAAK